MAVVTAPPEPKPGSGDPSGRNRTSKARPGASTPPTTTRPASSRTIPVATYASRRERGDTAVSERPIGSAVREIAESDELDHAVAGSSATRDDFAVGLNRNCRDPGVGDDKSVAAKRGIRCPVREEPEDHSPGLGRPLRVSADDDLSVRLQSDRAAGVDRAMKDRQQPGRSDRRIGTAIRGVEAHQDVDLVTTDDHDPAVGMNGEPAEVVAPADLGEDAAPVPERAIQLEAVQVSTDEYRRSPKEEPRRYLVHLFA